MPIICVTGSNQIMARASAGAHNSLTSVDHQPVVFLSSRYTRLAIWVLVGL